MSALEALVLGLIQGLTEFLPVSSSGHLVLAAALLGATDEGIVFEIAVHLATLLAIVVFYRRRIAELLVGALQGRAEAWRYHGKLALATVPAVALALSARDAIEAQFERPAVAASALLVTGLLLWTTRTTLPRATGAEPSWNAALWIGCAQALAMIPGISRSGSTVVAALALGVAPLAAAEFSFLLGVVAIAGAAVLTLGDATALDPSLIAPLAVGGAAALVSGIAAIWLFVRVLGTRHFHRFAYYVWIVGAVALFWLAVGP